MNLPCCGYKYNQTYGTELCNNVVGGRNIRYLNVPMHDMRRMVIDQLKDDEPVWFARDVLQEWNNPAGLLSLKVYDWKRSFGISLGKDKATRVQYRESMPTVVLIYMTMNQLNGRSKIHGVISLVTKTTLSCTIHGWINTLITL